MVLREILDRLGRTPKVNAFYNRFCEFDDEHKLQPDEKPTPAEWCDKALKHWFGEGHGWETFTRHGFIRWPKKAEEAYWRYFIDARHRIEDPSFDLYCFSYRHILHTGSHTMEQPWLDEASRMNPYTYNITMNPGVARQKGLKDGDVIELESATGGKVCGPVKLMEGQHPHTVGIAACSGHWTRGMPIAKGKGTNFDTLLACDLKHVDPVSLNIETAARVKVRKADASSCEL